MLWAESGSPEGATMGGWLQNFNALASMICMIVVALSHVVLARRKKRTSPKLKYVTRGELDQEISRLEAEVASMQKQLHSMDRQLVWISGVMSQWADKHDIRVAPAPAIGGES